MILQATLKYMLEPVPVSCWKITKPDDKAKGDDRFYYRIVKKE